MLADVEANEEALRVQRRELEDHLLVAPAANWQEAATKARYLLTLFAGSPTSSSTTAHCGGACRFHAPFRRYGMTHWAANAADMAAAKCKRMMALCFRPTASFWSLG
jgi:hypothetical protein